MRRLSLNLNLTSVITILAVGVMLPVLLSTAVGIVALVLAKDVGGVVTGVLVISFAATATGCGLAAVVLTGRKARLARRQADFVASVSHEFRTPLSAIRLYAQTLDSGKLANDPQQTAKCVEVILRETEWLDVMVDRVLTWRASSKDMVALKMETQPVSHAVEDAVERFRSMVEPDEVTLTCSAESRLPVRHDAGALNAVILNLLVNAHKYTPGHKRIAVRARDDGDGVVIEVEDNGPGVAPSDAKRIFQPFCKAGGPGRDDVGGMGLGLAIAKDILQRHSGDITVRSESGSGATFVVRLPASSGTP